jgi:hypothetical protein
MAIDLTLPPSRDSARFAADRSLRLAKAVHCRVINSEEDQWKTYGQDRVPLYRRCQGGHYRSLEPTTQRKRLDA